MGLSTGSELHIDKHLSNVAINYRPQTFIGDMIAPIVSVPNEKDTYPIFNRLEFYSTERTERARGTAARKITRSVSSAGFSVQNYALGMDIPIEDRANMDPALAYELDAGAARYLVGKLMLDYERRVLTLAQAATSVSTTFVPNSAWGGATYNTANAGDPYGAVLSAMEQMKGRIGQSPNRLLVGWRAHKALLRNFHIRNLVKGVNNGGGPVTREQLAALFEVDQYLVSEAQFTSQNEATTPSSLALQSVMADTDIIGYYAPSAPSREEPSWMYAFRWTNPLLGVPMAVERHPYDSRAKIEGMEAGYYQSERVVGPEYAFKIAGVNSAQSNGI